ncbi:Superoxide dismutase [Cu-Zn] [Sarcoptes scabiei]|nr:Superoxide dismutase [Cu-Zn] [Sarcoptes scabiei]
MKSSLAFLLPIFLGLLPTIISQNDLYYRRAFYEPQQQLRPMPYAQFSPSFFTSNLRRQENGPLVIVPNQHVKARFAVALFNNTETGVTGLVTFFQGGPHLHVEVHGILNGLTPGLHGFHVHEYGDMRNGCTSMGGHFNPFGKTHGSPAHLERHVGDLGNIFADRTGFSEFGFYDGQISLFPGLTEILGRGLVHANKDDLGQGGHKDSKTTGNAGGRVGCAPIVLAALPSNK